MRTRAPDPAPVPPAIGELADQDLMLLVSRGLIREPATELFERHNGALYNFVAWLCQGNLAEAEDLTQKTWLRLIGRCGDYKPGPATFRTFLFQIARNAFLDARRSAGERLRDDGVSQREADRLEVEDADPDPETLLLSDEAKTRLHAALMTLPVSQREVVVLRYFAELSLEEVAHTVGAGIETVRSRLRYAFRALRRELGPSA